MQNTDEMVFVAGTHSFRYRSSMRGGDFHVFENMDNGAASVITNTTFELASPYLHKSGNLYVYPKDELPAALCAGLSIPIFKRKT